MYQRGKDSTSARLPVPPDLHVGAVIGVGAANVKRIQTKYGVRCQIDAKKREAVVMGPRAAIDGAVDGLLDLFHRLRLQRLQVLERQRNKRNARPVVTRDRVYRIAAVVDSSHGSWMFQRLPDVEQFEERFENRLIHLESFDSEAGTDASTPEAHNLTGKWIEKFGAAFRRRMIQDVKNLTESGQPQQTVKMRAALGLTTFALPDANTACRLYTWEQLQDLQLHHDFRRRWENVCNRRSPSVAALMHELEARIPPNATYETALTIYVGFDDSSRRDISLKFQWTDNHWTKVMQRAPIREPHGLYNISLDDETAFRIRVYSREYLASHHAHGSDLWDAVELVMHPSGDPLRTEVVLREPGVFVRMVWLREKTKVDLDGMRYSISYSNAAHTHAIVQCQPIPLLTPPTSADKLRDLVNGLLGALKHDE